MHNYNPINKYSMRTRMGNWSEEWDLEETKYRVCLYLGAKSISGRKIMGLRRFPIGREFSCKACKV